jgi:hypothetical protein
LFILCSVADPGSGALLTPGSGIQDGWKIRIRIRDEQPGSYFRKIRNNILGYKIRFFDADPDLRSGIPNLFDPGSGIREPGWKKFEYGINTPDPQH